MSDNKQPAASVPEEDTEWGRAIPRPPSPVAKTLDNVEEVSIAIVGGGLVGLAAAIGLTRANISVKIFERAPELRSVSQGILGLQPNGLAALERIHPDLPNIVLEAGCERLGLVYTTIDENGNATDEVRNTGTETREKYGRPKIGMTWHKMQQVLYDLLPKDLIETGRSLYRFEEDEDSVMLYFENGSVVQANAVLACDGIFSAARRQMIPDDSPIFFGQLNWATIIETEKLPAEVHPPSAVHYFQYNGEPRWMSMLNDGGSGMTFWQFRVADPAKALLLSGNEGRGGLGLPGVKNALLPIAKPSPLVASAIKCIPEEQIFERSIVGRYPVKTWISSGGRLALVGDAAHGMHPNIGQGANNGFESAAILADSIVDAVASADGDKVDYKAALASYEKLRKPRADLVQRFSNMMGVLQAAGTTPITSSQREAMMHWILLSDPDTEPPSDVVEILETFDPCDHPGVSRLW